MVALPKALKIIAILKVLEIVVQKSQNIVATPKVLEIVVLQKSPGIVAVLKALEMVVALKVTRNSGCTKNH